MLYLYNNYINLTKCINIYIINILKNGNFSN